MSSSVKGTIGVLNANLIEIDIFIPHHVTFNVVQVGNSTLRLSVHAQQLATFQQGGAGFCKA